MRVHTGDLAGGGVGDGLESLVGEINRVLVDASGASILDGDDDGLER